MAKTCCSSSFKSIVMIVNCFVGIALAALGLYKFAKVSLSSPRDLFLNIYYIIFGILLFISECPYERVMNWFRFIVHPFGKSIFLLFLAAITYDIYTAVYLIYSIVLTLCAILQIFYLFIGYTPKIEKKNENKLEKNEQKNFQKVDLDADQKNLNMPPVDLNQNLARRK